MRLLAVALVLACGHAESTPAPKGAPPAPRAVPVDAPEAHAAGQEERLAAIQKAMNDLSPIAQACWATVAAVRFDVEGELTAQIEIAPTKVTIIRDTAHNARLAGCMTEVLTAYPWAPPLRGQTIQLPFKFRMPDGQSVIDRRLVPWTGQGKVSVAALLDEDNTGNPAASLIGIRIADGGATGLRAADRAEVWYFETAAEVRPAVGKPFTVAAGDLVYVPIHGARNVAATHGAVTAMIAILPGGREGVVRGGALPTPEMRGWDKPPPEPRLLASGKPIVRPWGSVAIAAEPSVTSSKAFAVSVIELAAGAVVPEHTHAGETELLYVLAGTGTLTVAGVALPIIDSSVIQVPPATKHAVTVKTAIRAIQIYTPAGPEQRFKAP